MTPEIENQRCHVSIIGSRARRDLRSFPRLCTDFWGWRHSGMTVGESAS
jgi:hypothetical protein